MTLSSIYTAITFAPVQGFIEKSRKLRDLYGSSFILSYLSERICLAARQHLTGKTKLNNGEADPVISPALIDVTQGVPNQILIRGEFPYQQAHSAFHQAWTDVVETCRTWIEDTFPNQENGDRWEYEYWQRTWQAWTNHTWEFFWATGATGDDAKANLNERKLARDWTGINWTGESSTLSGIDSRAWPHLGKHKPYSRPQTEENAEVQAFYGRLNKKLGDATITTREFLSIPELVKRLITIEEVANYRQQLTTETPLTFGALNRLLNRDEEDLKVNPEIENAERDEKERKRWTGWFQGDGDKAGDYLRNKDDADLHQFSHHMRSWGAKLKNYLPKAELRDPPKKKLDRDGRIIYAGGDDFLGVLYRNYPFPAITPIECLRWLETFKSQVWSYAQEPITVSVGFVWAAPNVPQRDVLQHCREAEQSAKRSGRDRIAFRILFNSGNHLEWVCPWWLLEGDFSNLSLPPDKLPETGLIAAYCDRNQRQGYAQSPNWTHIYNDVGVLETRHAFSQSTDVALGLIEIYFGQPYRQLLENQEYWFNQYNDEKIQVFTGILGDIETYRIKNRQKDNFGELDQAAIQQAFNDWVINLAKVGFHLTQTSDKVQPDSAIAA